MFHYSIRALFAIVLLAACASAVLFAFPVWLRVATMFVGVLAMPGPLMLLYRRGAPLGRSFALGGLTAYIAWLIVAGVPGAFSLVASSAPFANTLSGLAEQSAETTIRDLVVNGYSLLSVLYAPWLAVPLAGITSVAIHWLILPPQGDKSSL